MQSIIQYLNTQIALQRDKLFLWIPVCVGIGIILYFSNVSALSIQASIGGIVQCSVVAALCRYFYGINKYPSLNLGLYYLMLAFAFIFLGMGSAAVRDYMVQTPIVEQDQFVELSADIQSISRVSGGKAKRVTLENIQILDDGKDLRLETVRLRSYHFKGDAWGVGDRVQVTARLLAPSGPIIPNGFDFREKAKFDRLSATGFTIKDAALIHKASSDVRSLQKFRESIANKVYASMNPEIAGVALALLTGERSDISKGDSEAMRASGLAHILAISGLHIGLVAGCVFFFIRLILSCVPNLALYYPIKKWAALGAILIAFSYMMLAGATVPTIRAFIMTALVLTAIIMDRSAINLRLVAIAALVVMILTPEKIMGPSFQLSFAAVVALIAFYQGAGRKWLVHASAYHVAWRPFYYLAGIILTTVIATLATAPFTISFFNRIAVFSVLSNILAMPIMSFLVMPFGLLALILMSFNMSENAWVIMAYGIDNILTIARAIAAYEHADLYLPSLSDSDKILTAIGFVILVLWQGHLRWLGAAIIIVVLMVAGGKDFHRIYIDEKAEAAIIVDTKKDVFHVYKRPSRYEKAQWLADVGVSPTKTLSTPLSQCDDFMCVYPTANHKVVFIDNPLYLNRACEVADILISRVPVRGQGCENGRTVIDRFDGWRHGVHVIDFYDGDYHISTTR